jgi:two-component system CheB/CheR fusion protein
MIAAGSGAGRRVLVVDDHVASVTSLSLVLSLLGYDVRCAFDGLEAVRCAAEFKPEVAILDLSLPLLDGYGVAQRLRAMEETRDTLLVAMTGWGSATVSERVRASGFDLHLVKPVSVDRLTDALQLAGC